MKSLEEIATYIVSDGKGILAADESTPTIGKRFATINAESTEDSRRDYREMLFRADGMKNNIGGVILFDETLRQDAKDGTPLKEIISEQGALPGIKVDKGISPLDSSPEENITGGLDGLDKRCAEYFDLGAKFTKWRAVIKIADGLPSQEAIKANMDALADYAKIVQENNMVPIVEPEVLMDGSHSIESCEDATKRCLGTLFESLEEKNVLVEGTILKPNMIVSGNECSEQAGIQQVAEMTLNCLLENVPSNLPGVTFLSGGQSDIDATAHLDAMNKIGGNPWKLSFSYGRALQQAALKTWSGKQDNEQAAQEAFSHRAKMNMLAAKGEWSENLEG
jgi:fructose-bisphosphate aldolase class I